MKTLILPVLLLSTLACAPPERDYEMAEIQAVSDLSTLMWVQATVADPRFDLAEELSGDDLTDGQRAEFEDMAKRLKACATKLHEFASAGSDAESFGRFAEKQGLFADQLMAAASIGDARATADAVGSIQQNCSDCHDEHR